MRYALTVLAYLASLAVVGVISFFIVILLAGPHAGILPQPLEVVVLIAGWVVVLAAPVFAARVVWKRVGKGRVV